MSIKFYNLKLIGFVKVVKSAKLELNMLETSLEWRDVVLACRCNYSSADMTLGGSVWDSFSKVSGGH